MGFSSEGRILYAKAVMSRLLGMPAEELVGHNVLDFVSLDQKPSIQDRIMARDPGAYDATLLSPQGPKRLRITPTMLTTHIRMILARETPDPE